MSLGEIDLIPVQAGGLRCSQAGKSSNGDERNELIRRMARSTWQRNSEAISIRGFFGSVTPPTVTAYKSGKNERIFTCRYVYDFTLALRNEGQAQ